jgi:dUTP pyrophosphatase
MEKLLVEKLSPTAKLPTRGHYNDAGLDIYADETVILQPGEHQIIKTGIKIAVPDGYVALVWDKGGLAKDGLHTIAGVIDSGYRGEVSINLVNLTLAPYTITQGQKFAQILIQPVSLCEVQEEVINDITSRGDGKHGSTGLF